MKRVYIFLLLLVTVFSCKKKQAPEDDGYVYISGSGLTGKWLARERNISSGGAPYMVNMQQDQWFTFEFRSDSSIVYSAKMPKADSLFDHYSAEGSFIKLRSTLNTKTDRWFYQFLPDGRLDLNIVLCFEGCSYILRRIQ